MTFKNLKKLFFFLGISLFMSSTLICLFNNPLFFRQSFFHQLRRQFYKCKVDEIHKIPFNSHIIIGHAYGHPSNNNNFLAPIISRFIKENKNKIKSIVFSGDIIAKPSLEKWDQLYNLVGDNIEIYIAPGNHDIGLKADSPSRKIFYQSKLSKGFYPQRLTLGSYNIILDESVSSNWQINEDVIDLYKRIGSESNNIIIRHNIPVLELLLYANSEAGLKKNLPSFNELSKKFNDQITIIAGDTGAFKRLPRLGCWRFNNLKVIINGIGEINGDSILLIQDNKIFKYTLT